MRLQLTTAAALGAVMLAGPARAESGDAGARVDVYADGDIVVVAPSVRANVAGDVVTVDTGHLVNIISGATPIVGVDAVSGATRIEEVRHGLDLSLQGALGPNAKISGGYVASLEPDFIAHGPTLNVQGDAFGQMTRISATYRLRFEWMAPAGGGPLSQLGTAHELDLTWTQILGPTTRLTVLLSGAFNDCGKTFGCHANPYRYVAVGSFALRERHPAQRARIAAGLRVAQALGTNLALHGGYRFHYDTWKVQAHTGDLALAAAIAGERLLLRGSVRFTRQTAASFHRNEYGPEPMPPRYVTADRELSGMWSLMLAVRAEPAFFAVGPFARLAPSVRVAYLGYGYPDHPTAPRRNALLIGGGLDVEF